MKVAKLAAKYPLSQLIHRICEIHGLCHSGMCALRRFMDDVTTFEFECSQLNAERLATEAAVRKTKDQLRVLQRTNCFDDLFHIYYSGYFATINGFKLGRLSSQAVRFFESMSVIDANHARKGLNCLSASSYPTARMSRRTSH